MYIQGYTAMRAHWAALLRKELRRQIILHGDDRPALVVHTAAQLRRGNSGVKGECAFAPRPRIVFQLDPAGA